jgi:hypothetical protein
MSKIERNSGVFPVKITADPATSQVIPFGAAAAAIFICTDGGGQVEWHVVAKSGDDPVPLLDHKNNPVVSDVAAGSAVELPPAVFAASFLVGLGTDCEGYLCVSG